MKEFLTARGVTGLRANGADGWWKGRAPSSEPGKAPAFGVNLPAGVWCDHRTGEHGGLVRFNEVYDNLSRQDAARDVARFFGLPWENTLDHPPGLPEPDAPPGDTPPRELTTDRSNAERLLAAHGQDLRYAPEWKSWLWWDQRHWARVTDIKVTALAAEVPAIIRQEVADLYGQAATETAPGRRREMIHSAEELRKWMKKSEAAERLRATVTYARALVERIDWQDLDPDPWLLTVLNGTVDLRTGSLRPHDRVDLITHLAPVSYAPDATCPRFDKFVDEVFSGDIDLINYVWRFIGYAVSGTVDADVLVIFQGAGRNGKGTLMETIVGLLGDYATTAAPGLLMAHKGDRHPTEIADLWGRRLVVSSEANKGCQFDEARVKSLTGGDRLKGRGMKENFWEFKPTAKFIIAVNPMPTIKGTDAAIWARIHLVRFRRSFLGSEATRSELLAAFATERSGILNRALAGCLDYQHQKLAPPPGVQEASQDYRKSQDRLGDFLDDVVEKSPGGTVPKIALYAAYESWAGRERIDRPLSKWSLGQALKERGYIDGKSPDGNDRIWVGIAPTAAYRNSFSADEPVKY